MSVKVVDHPSRGRLPAAALLARARDLLLGQLGPRLEDLLTSLDDDLFSRAEAARSDRAQQAFFDAMRLLRLEREQICRRFRLELDAAAPDEAASADGEKAADDGFQNRVDALSLLADEALEERLAVTTMSQRVERDCELRLTLLRARLAHLRERAPDSVPPVPVEPRSVAGAFARSITPLEFDTEVRLVLFKRFEQGVLLGLVEAYEELDRVLRSAGVLPDLTPAQALGGRAPARRPGASRRPDPEPEARDAPAGAAPAEAPSHGTANEHPSPHAAEPSARPADDVFDVALARAFEGLAPTQLTSTLATLPGLRRRRRYAPTSETDAVVSNLLLEIASAAQLRLAPLLAERSLDAVPQRIDYGALLTRGAEKRGHDDARLEAADEDLVNLVQALFDELLGNDDLPVPVRALLARIQFPILRIALADSSFLSSAAHPARRFLDLITRTGIGWAQSDERAQDRLYQVIEQSVDEAARGDGAEFESLNTRIEDALASEEALIRRASERVLEKERARLEAEKTRRLVERLVDHRCRSLPEGELQRFLTGDWQQVMYRAHQQDGARSDAWKGAFAVLRALTGAEDLDGQALHRAIAEGLGRLGQAPEHAAQDAARAIDLMLEQQRSAEQDEDQGRDDTTTTAEAPAPAAPANVAPAPEAPVPEAPASAAPAAPQAASIEKLPDRGAMDAASALAVDDWIEIVQTGGRRVRCRLASVTEPPERCIFLNRRGIRIETLSRLEIAAAIQQGDIRRLDSDQIFDNTLASVIGGLREGAAVSA